MIKKVLLPITAILLSTTSLFAYKEGDIVIYPEAGLGASTVILGSELSGSDFTTKMNSGGNSYSFKKAKSEADRYWHVGANGKYFFTDSLSFIGGISFEKSCFKIVYKSLQNTDPNAEFKFTSHRLNIPLGVSYYYGHFVAGGGAYLGIPLSLECKESPYFNNEDKIKSIVNAGFFLEAGFNIYTTDTSNLTIVMRIKGDLSKINKTSDDVPIERMKISSASFVFAYGFQIN